MSILPSPFEQVETCCPKAEVWWDSPPQVFPTLIAQMLSAATTTDDRVLWSAQLATFLNVEAPEKSLVKGVTTNPSLLSHWIQSDAEFWTGVIAKTHNAHRAPSVEAVFQLVYHEAVRLAALMMRPLWEASGGQYGWVSGQTDPRIMFDEDAMIAQGRALATLGPNVMVKIPGNDQGYRVIRSLTAEGISTNSTLSFTVPQFAACIDAVEQGRAEAARNGTKAAPWRNVITHMIGRFGKMNDLPREAQLRGIDLTLEDIRYGEIAILKQALALIDAGDHPVKMLLSSLLTDDDPLGDANLSMHLEHTAGAPVIYTCKPDYVSKVIRNQDLMRPLRPDAINAPIPSETLRKLRALPTFCAAIDPEGIPPQFFSATQPFLGTQKEVTENVLAAIDFVAHHMDTPDIDRDLPFPIPPIAPGATREAVVS